MIKKYRKNVCIVVCKKGNVLLCARADKENDCWQFPQGGIEKEEDIIDAAKRELFEETGIKNVKLIEKMPFSVTYDFPKDIKNPYLSQYKGQEQFWVLFEFLGNDDEINLNINSECIEFKKYKWDKIETAPKEIVEFKKKIYKKAVEYLKPFVEEINK